MDLCPGPSAQKRLAARLIPRFVKDFPQYAAAAGASLLRLCNDRGRDRPPESISAGIRKDAIKGLGCVCEALTQDRASSTLPEVVAFLVKCVPLSPTSFTFK